MKDEARAKAAPIEGAVGAAVPRYFSYFSNCHGDRGWYRPLSCFPTHSLNEGERLTFGIIGEAEILPSWHSPTQQDPSPGSCLPPTTYLFPASGPHSIETKPHAGDVPSLSSLTPSHTPFPLFSTFSNYPSTIWDEYSVTLLIKGAYSQENLVSQAIQSNSLDGRTGLHLCPNRSQC